MFDDTYEVVLADTEAARKIHRKIRYHVYCVERHFEAADEFPSGEESDRWDSDAAQFIVRERVSGQCVAAMRLVLPRAVDFPVEALGCLDPKRAGAVPRRETAEISRICVIRSPNPTVVNDRLGEGFGYVSRQREFEVLIGMLRTIKVYGLGHRIEHCYLLVTDVLARLLRRLGVVLYQVGVAKEHRGYRTPYVVNLRESAASMCLRSVAVHEMFAREELAYRRSAEIDEDTIDPDSLLIEPMVAVA